MEIMKEQEQREKYLTYCVWGSMILITFFALIIWIIFFVEIGDIEMTGHREPGAGYKGQPADCQQPWLTNSLQNISLCDLRCDVESQNLSAATNTTPVPLSWHKAEEKCVACLEDEVQVVQALDEDWQLQVNYCQLKCEGQQGKSWYTPVQSCIDCSQYFWTEQGIKNGVCSNKCGFSRSFNRYDKSIFVSSMDCVNYVDELEQISFTNLFVRKDAEPWRIRGSLTEPLTVEVCQTDDFLTPYSQNSMPSFDNYQYIEIITRFDALSTEEYLKVEMFVSMDDWTMLDVVLNTNLNSENQCRNSKPSACFNSFINLLQEKAFVITEQFSETDNKLISIVEGMYHNGQKEGLIRTNTETLS